MPDNIGIVAYTDAYTEALSKIITRNFFEVNIRDYPIEEMRELSRKYTPENIKEYACFRKIFVALLDGNPAGTLCTEDCGDHCYMIAMVFVSPEHHGKGIGRRMMEEGEKQIKSAGGRRVLLNASLTAHRFYQKLGYRYMAGDACPGQDGCYPMFKELI